MYFCQDQDNRALQSGETFLLRLGGGDEEQFKSKIFSVITSGKFNVVHEHLVRSAFPSTYQLSHFLIF